MRVETQVDSLPEINLGGAKRTGELDKGPRKKQCAQLGEYDVMVTLTEWDLEQIADTITMATKDKWVALEEQ